MKLKITIEMDNAAFFDDEESPHRNAEVGMILHTLAQHIENAWEMEPGHGYPVMDSNGNRVGKAEVTK
jgi:hypothetical protein